MMNKGFLLFRKRHVRLPTYCIGHPEYGCFISKDKTMTNFDYDHQIMNVIDQRARRAWSFFILNPSSLKGITHRFPLVWVCH